MRNFIGFYITVFIAFAGCRAETLLKNNFFTSILKGLVKLAYQSPVRGMVKNLVIEAFGYFYHHLYIVHLPLYFQFLGALFF